MIRVSNLVALASFILAGLWAYATAWVSVRWIEERSVQMIGAVFAANGLSWVELYADGLEVELSGNAASESARFRALSLASDVVGSGRLIDAMEVTRARARTRPAFSLEILRGADEISLIGVVPSTNEWQALTTRLGMLNRRITVTDMTERSNHKARPGWNAALRFALTALEDLAEAQISVMPGSVAITTVTDSDR